MVTGAAESWYHEKQSSWLYGVVAAAEPDPMNRALCGKLAAATENRAACWLATRPPDEQQVKPVFTPALRARIVARLVRWTGPKRLRELWVYSGSHALASHAMPITVAAVGKRHASAGGNLRAAVLGASIAG